MALAVFKIYDRLLVVFSRRQVELATVDLSEISMLRCKARPGHHVNLSWLDAETVLTASRESSAVVQVVGPALPDGVGGDHAWSMRVGLRIAPALLTVLRRTLFN